MTRDALTIGTVASQAGVTVETLRFYHRRGLLPLPPRPLRGVRRYPPDAVDRVRFIKAAQAWGFSLADIGDLLRLEDGAACEDTRRLAEARLATVSARLRELRRFERALRAAIAACRGRRGRMSCPLIASLRGRGLAR